MWIRDFPSDAADDVELYNDNNGKDAQYEMTKNKDDYNKDNNDNHFLFFWLPLISSANFKRVSGLPFAGLFGKISIISH